MLKNEMIIYGRMASITLMVSICVICGCKSRHGILARADIPIGMYVRSVLAANGREGRIMAFPTMQIYDAGGNLIFRSHDVDEVSATLNRLPDGTKALRPISGTASMEAAITSLPCLQTQRDTLLRRRAPTVIVVFLENCRACSMLDGSLMSVQQHLLDQGENLILLKVNQPS
jgi:hypothetical protein